MYIVIEKGSLFEGSLEEFNDWFAPKIPAQTFDDVKAFCKKEDWHVKIYKTQSESWN